jgi:hypothetical protein
MNRNGPIAAIALLAFVNACKQLEHREQPVTADAAVAITHSPVHATIGWSAEKKITLSIPVEVRNTGTESVGVVSCNWDLEEFKNGVWQTVWTPPCPTTPTDPNYLEGGERRTMSLSVSARLYGAKQDWSGAPGGGTYRVKLWVVREGASPSRYPEIVSNDFGILAQ